MPNNMDGVHEPDEPFIDSDGFDLEAELEQVAIEEAGAAASRPGGMPEQAQTPSDAELPQEPATTDPDPAESAKAEPAADAHASIDQAPEASAEDQNEPADIIEVTPQANSPQFDAEGFVEEINAVERDLAAAKKAHNKAVSNAKSAVKKARAEYDSAIKKAERALEKQIATYSERVASFAGATLFYDRITFENRRIPMAADVHAEMEIAEVTMAAEAGGTEPKSEVVVTVSSPQASMRITGEAERAETARRFAVEVNNTAAEAAQRAAEKEQAINDGNARIRDLRADTSRIEQAEAALREAEADTGEIERLSAQLNEMESSASDVEREALNSSRKAAREKKFTTRFLLIAAVIIVVLLIVMRVMTTG